MHDDLRKKAPSAEVTLSVVIPVFNREAALIGLFDRLYPVLDGLGQTYEVVFVDDGGGERCATLLRQQHKLRTDTTRVVYLRGHVGQDAAITAGLAACVGRRIVTLDPELECPPEEILHLLSAMDRGHDTVGAVRRLRQDAKWREIASGLANRLRERITGIRMDDPGCTLRAYDREIVDAVLASGGTQGSVPSLAYRYAANPTEIRVEREADAAAETNVPFLQLLDLNFDLIRGASVAPLRIFPLVGFGISIVSFGIAICLVLRWMIAGPEGEALLGLFGLLFFLAGVILFGIGLLGAYLGQVIEQARGRLPYLVREELIPHPAARRPKS